MFCSLNMGVSGLVRDSLSIDLMREHYQIGDIIDVQVQEEFDSQIDFDTERPLVILTLPSQNDKIFHSHFLSCLAASTDFLA